MLMPRSPRVAAAGLLLALALPSLAACRTSPDVAAYVGDARVTVAELEQGLDERLRHETQMPVHLAESPLTCVAVGSGRSLEEFEAIHRSNRARARRNGNRRYS